MGRVLELPFFIVVCPRFLSPNKGKESVLGVGQVRQSRETVELTHGAHSPCPVERGKVG